MISAIIVYIYYMIYFHYFYIVPSPCSFYFYN